MLRAHGLDLRLNAALPGDATPAQRTTLCERDAPAASTEGLKLRLGSELAECPT